MSNSSTVLPLRNRRVLLASRPKGLPDASCWQFEDVAIAPLDDGQVLVKVLQLSLDPAMRGWMNEGKSYIRPVAIGEVMRAGGIGEVLASRVRASVGTSQS